MKIVEKLTKEQKIINTENRRIKKYNEQHIVIEDTLYKKCALHNKYFPEESEWIICNDENFNVNRSNSIDGYNPYCKPCNRKKTVIWIENNEEKYREGKKKYVDKNIGKMNDYRTVWTREHPERVKKFQKEYRKINADKINGYSRKRNKKNHKINQKEWDECRIYFNFRCSYCDKTWEQNKLESKKDLHKEHFDESGSLYLDNCIPACNSCNSQKWKFSFDEWYNVKNTKFSEIRKLKILKWLLEDHKIHRTSFE